MNIHIGTMIEMEMKELVAIIWYVNFMIKMLVVDSCQMGSAQYRSNRTLESSLHMEQGIQKPDVPATTHHNPPFLRF